ncbi:D-amino-acid transaminase [Terrihabitans soli]|uniref:Probable branched-chain-amino-acid aminotransferase n=1 Tax=Terrihabitans soli TaxID=708113 RepID=A0A6S6QNL5_9HYPH|nr:D-amino-acid transaminase [Terrihabitans soli]BCJ91016.1 D-amino-acid transaminase [Terrihabitans soli]
MSRIVYVNGRYVPYAEASVHIDDRGFQFADGVYEVCEVRDGRIIDEPRHFARLKRSLDELKMAAPMNEACLSVVLTEVLHRNRVRSGLVYLQVTRGVARREFFFPADDVPPTLVVTARSVDPLKGESVAAEGIRVVTVPENRWERVDIKTTGLLPNVLAKMQAKAAGAREAWFVDRDGFITEGGSSNAWIISEEDVLITRPAESGILRGVTRTTLIDLARKEGLKVEERAFTVTEAKVAKEAFITSATTIVTPVIELDSAAIGGGKPGPLVKRLRSGFHAIAAWRSI